MLFSQRDHSGRKIIKEQKRRPHPIFIFLENAPAIYYFRLEYIHTSPVAFQLEC